MWDLSIAIMSFYKHVVTPCRFEFKLPLHLTISWMDSL